MKILVDENIPLVTETFAKHGEVQTYIGRTLEAEQLVGVDALITRSVTKVNAGLLSKSQPSFIGTCTIGTDHLDIPLLESHAVKWTSAPGCNAQSVVDYVLSVLACFNPIGLFGDYVNDTSTSQSNCVIGILGCGNVGGLLRRRFIQMGLNVRVYDPFLTESDIPELGSLEDVFRSNIVCMHTPFTSEGPHPTSAMVNKQLLELLPDNACLISAGRGGVLVESDLASFIDKRPDVQIALDVWESEPRINPLLVEKVKIATPHIAGYSLEGKCRGTLQIYQKFCETFELDPVVDIGFIQTLDKKELSLEPFSGNKSIRSMILSAYDPLLDTNRMRQGRASATENERATGSWFDEQRRSYPERRELESFSVEGELNQANISKLEKYGFINF